MSAQAPLASRSLREPARVIEGRALTKVYRMGEVDVHALRGVDIDLFEREFIVLLGASGSGKSTQLNILGGLDVPSIAQGERVVVHPSDRLADGARITPRRSP